MAHIIISQFLVFKEELFLCCQHRVCNSKIPKILFCFVEPCFCWKCQIIWHICDVLTRGGFWVLRLSSLYISHKIFGNYFVNIIYRQMGPMQTLLFMLMYLNLCFIFLLQNKLRLYRMFNWWKIGSVIIN